MAQVAKFLKVLLFVAFVGVVGYFGYNNQESVAINFAPVAEIRVPVYLSTYVSFAIGAVFGAGFFTMDLIRKNFQIKKLKRQISEQVPVAAVVPQHADPAPAVSTS